MPMDPGTSMQSSKPPFWSGTEQQYFELYRRIAHSVKEADPRALVGAPAIAKPNDNTPYRDEFLPQVRSTHTPLDFYSWHWYATDSNDPLRPHLSCAPPS